MSKLVISYYKKLILVTSMLAYTSIASSSLLADDKIADKDSGFCVGAGAGKSFNKFGILKDASNDDNFSGLTLKNDVNYQALLGYRFNKIFRTDINGQTGHLVHKSNPRPSTTYRQKVSTKAIFLNGYIGAPNYTVFTPYLTAGGGYTRIKVGDFSVRDRLYLALNKDVPSDKGRNGFAWNVGVGTTMLLYENLTLDLSYRYLNLGKIKTNISTTILDEDFPDEPEIFPETIASLKESQLQLSLIYNF